MPALRRRRLRVPLLWAGFALASAATGLAVNHLYETVRREIAEQGERALVQERDRAISRIQDYADSVRRSIIEELAAFHVEGLAYALRQWDEENEILVGTFQWRAGRGFLPGSAIPDSLARPGELAMLWQQFRAWRAEHPSASDGGPGMVGAYRTVHYRTIDNPAFAAASLGYQAENLDILAYAGRPVDPWAGCAGRADDPGAPWIIWYQEGPDAVVRGCLVDAAPVVRQLRGELADRRLARLELVAAQDPGAGGPAAAIELDSLPAHALAGGHGEVFLEKRTRARFSALAVALLLGLFLVGVAFLGMFSRREARDAERKTTFVSQVSHELRTPLTSIRMFADMLATPGLAEEKRARYAGTISRESRRLGDLIERLLTFNALEKGKLAVAIRPVDVAEVVRETLEEMEATLRDAGMQADVSLPGETVIAATDRSTLKQALLNLLDNAVKYAREGGTVHVTLAAASDPVRLRVADHGPGIPRSVRPRLFEPFVQGAQRLTDKPSGVGLGLSIAREMLRHTGGDLVLLRSRNGATFEIRLPASNA